MIFIVTNRKIIKDENGNEVINNDGNEVAKHDFRIAEYNETTKSADLLPDMELSSYNLAASSAVTEGGTNNMFFRLYSDMMENDNSDVLLFMHGFNYKLEDELEHIESLKKRYLKKKSNIEHMIYLSWPSQGTLDGYLDDQKDARETGRILARLYEKLLQFYHMNFHINGNESCQKKIHLAAHSMGNQVLEHMMINLDKRLINPVFSEILLINSDVDSDIFNKGEAFERLHEMGDRVHIYTHRGDDALLFSKAFINKKRRLGQRGPDCLKSLPSNVFVVNQDKVTNDDDEATATHKLADHWGYLYSSEVKTDMRKVFKGIDEDKIRGRRLKRNSDNFYYL